MSTTKTFAIEMAGRVSLTTTTTSLPLTQLRPSPTTTEIETEAGLATGAGTASMTDTQISARGTDLVPPIVLPAILPGTVSNPVGTTSAQPETVTVTGAMPARATHLCQTDHDASLCLELNMIAQMLRP